MKTLTVTAARSRLGYWLKRAERGEEIGVIIGGRIIALHPVTVTEAGYAEREYGMTSAQVDRAAARIIASVRKAKTVPFVPGMFLRANRTDKTLSRRRSKAA